MKTRLSASVVVAFTALSGGLTAIVTAAPVAPPNRGGPEAFAAPPWGQVIAELVAGATLPPPSEARAYAIMYLATDRTITALRAGATSRNGDAGLEELAGSSAASEVLMRIIPSGGQKIGAAAALVHAAAARSVEHQRAVELGRVVAGKVLAERDRDHWADLEDSPLAELRLAESAAPDERPSKSPWLAATPFGLKNAAQFPARLPYWRDVGGELHPDTLIVRAHVFDHVDRTLPAQVLAQTWSGSTVAAWNRVAQQVFDRAGSDFATRVHALALVNVAMADATLAALHEQSLLGRWQTRWEGSWVPTDEPVTAADVVVDVRSTGEQLVYRPITRAAISEPLRNYPALGATVAAAAAAALAVIPKVEKIGFAFESVQAPGAASSASRRFSSVREAARECAFAAGLDGKTSREACAAGYDLGEQIGHYVLKRFPVPKS